MGSEQPQIIIVKEGKESSEEHKNNSVGKGVLWEIMSQGTLV